MTLPRSAVAIGLLLATGLTLVACSTAISSASPSTIPSAIASPARATTAPSVSPSVAGPQPSTGRTQTGWGVIWDSLPTGFPLPAGATPAEETATGPASANLVVDGSGAKAIATSVQQALGTAGYITTGLQGPLENGGYVLDMTGPGSGCEVQVAAAPLGGVITVTVMYGAGCPHD